MSTSLFGWNRWRLGRDRSRSEASIAALAERRLDARTGAAVAANIAWAEDNGSASEPAWIHDTSLHGLGLRSTRELPVGRAVWITRPSGPSLKATVRNCRSERDGFRIGVRLVDRERRRLDRDPAAGQAVLSWVGEGGRGVRVPVRVCNVAEGGLQLGCESPAPVGAAVKLSGAEIGCVGSVRYCVLRGDRYLIGLQFVGEPYARAIEQEG